MKRLKFLKIYLKITTSFFILSIILGILSSLVYPDYSEKLILSFGDKIRFAENLRQAPLFWFIFINNALVSLVIILSGFFLALLPIFLIFSNGELLGIVIGVTYTKIGIIKILLGLIPHGIFELPAIMLSASLGLMLAVKFIKRLIKREKFLPNLKNALLIYIEIIIPLLILAGIIESLLFEFFV